MTISQRVQLELGQGVKPVDTRVPSPLTKQVTSPTKATHSSNGDDAGTNKGKTWTPEEHERFLQGVEMFPRGPWKAIAEFIGTKTARQTMTHSQKFREKMARRKRGLVRNPSAASAARSHRKASIKAAPRPVVPTRVPAATGPLRPEVSTVTVSEPSGLRRTHARQKAGQFVSMMEEAVMQSRDHSPREPWIVDHALDPLDLSDCFVSDSVFNLDMLDFPYAPAAPLEPQPIVWQPTPFVPGFGSEMGMLR